MKKSRIILLLLAGALLFPLFSVRAHAAGGEAEDAPRANIYFINVSAYNLSGDCILIESTATAPSSAAAFSSSCPASTRANTARASRAGSRARCM